MNIIHSILVALGLRNPVTHLANASTNIVDVFNKTINDLTKVNVQADEHIQEKQAKQEKLAAEQAALVQIKENNQKVIGKISKIFE